MRLAPLFLCLACALGPGPAAASSPPPAPEAGDEEEAGPTHVTPPATRDPFVPEILARMRARLVEQAAETQAPPPAPETGH
ncbi:hypothetical protein EKE94_16005 [Mesobaculum littorinae]|uniref:Uncharacterized protein n=1 Tax=Mesobaculum littorinae TaxID=2486419 RepID=A0A438ADT2_9RHOB|nr:hypothetical protein [Mesobaculum littorinae]RVV96849.1 hypothetical protein EKE94_16005 [Mesobaculum littorinae]